MIEDQPSIRDSARGPESDSDAESSLRHRRHGPVTVIYLGWSLAQARARVSHSHGRSLTDRRPGAAAALRLTPA